MKIRIEFTAEEKRSIMNACDIHDDYSAKSEGNFGKAEYNAEEKFLQFDLNENFTIAVANLIATAANMLKSLINTFRIFESSWLTDIKTERPDKKEESKSEADESQNA